MSKARERVDAEEIVYLSVALVAIQRHAYNVISAAARAKHELVWQEEPVYLACGPCEHDERKCLAGAIEEHDRAEAGNDAARFVQLMEADYRPSPSWIWLSVMKP